MSEDGKEDKFDLEEYRTWKKNTPFLYDILLTKGLEWPSLTVQWNKSLHNVNDIYQKQQLLLGTQTSDQDKNLLMFANIKLPSKTTSSQEYSKIENKISTETIIEHEGDVNRARINPFKENIIATKSSNGKVYIFNKFLHPSRPHQEQDKRLGSQETLIGHEAEGYGLSWSKFEENVLISGSNDRNICVWDINNPKPLLIFSEHTDIVEDVCSCVDNKNLIVSVSDDQTLRLFDLRESKSVFSTVAHEGNINCVDINLINKNLLLTGSSDRTVALWDMRKLDRKNYIFDFHTDDVVSVKWNYKHECLFASGSSDKKINVWDVSKIGCPLSVADSEDGPPELMFIHAGHVSSVSDLDWNPNEGREFLLASVENENMLHVFEIASTILSEYNEDKIEIK